MGIKQSVLVIFDRGYPSIEFIDFLETEGIHYLIRLSSNDYKAERKQMQSEDEKERENGSKDLQFNASFWK